METLEATAATAAGNVTRRRVRFSREMSLYLARGLLVYGFVAFFILEVVWGTILTVRATEKYNLDFLIILPVLLWTLGESLSYTIPISLLFASGLLAGRIRADRELLACQSFGISPAQLLMAIAFIGGLFTVISYEVNQRWVPNFRDQTRNNMRSFMMDQLPHLGEGFNLTFRMRPYILWIHHHDGPRLEGIFLTIVPGRNEESSPVSMDVFESVDTATYPFYLFAERAYIGRRHENETDYKIRFEGVTIFVNDELVADGSARFIQRGYMSSWEWSIPVASSDRGPKELDRGALAEAIPRSKAAWDRAEPGSDKARILRRNYLRLASETHRRWAVALTCLMFPLTAFAIGLAINTMNRLLPFFVSCTAVPAIFFFAEVWTKSQTKKGDVIPWATPYLGNALLLVLLIFLMWKLAQGPKESSWWNRGKAAIECWRRRRNSS